MARSLDICHQSVAEKIRFLQPMCPQFFLLRGRFYRTPSLSCRLRQGLLECGLSFAANQRQGSRRTCWERFVGKMQNCVTNVDTTKMGMVLPANELHVEEAVHALKSGQVIAVPTDTLYGLACDACSVDAVNRIYEIKGRKLTSPLAICVGKVSDICRFAVTENLPNDLLESLLPGPVTVVLLRGDSSNLEESLNPGLDSIGIRVPDATFIQAVAQGFGSAIALTSANLSGQPSSVDIKDFEDLWPLCAHIYDGGQLPVGRSGSTVVDLTNPGKYKILRPGSALEETGNVLRRFNLEEVV
ncbi:uncharacterized protein LOC116255383 isoform X1 [Nymphaea colorata]|nr:uncharacterized protein LOC116255383 isoform X1 [Nymphaea colorata]